jgi:NADH-quinone oxidoreductase subunit G
MNAALAVSEPRPPQDEDSPLAFSMEGFNGVSTSSYLVPYYWAPGWNSVQAMNKYTDEPGGSYISGDPGVLLFNGKTGPIHDFFKEIPLPFIPEIGKLRIVPVSLIFGSDELSAESEPISGLIPVPFLLINQNDVSALTITEDNFTNITINHLNIKLKVKIDNSIPVGIAGISSMLPGMPYLKLPELCRIEKAGT